MLCAIRKSDGQTVNAYDERKENGPFRCLECGDPVMLKIGQNRINHFAHENPIARHYAENESDDHRSCKMQIFEALKRHPNVRDVAMERPFGTNRPDVSARINGVPVAIEIQISNLSLETIMQRTIEYHRKGIYVLWLLLWTPELNSPRYTPKLWEKWIHAAYFGRVYYWLEELKVAAYHFEPHTKLVPQKSWYSPAGKKMTGGGYTTKSKRYRTTTAGDTFNLATDFGPQTRYWWEGGGIKVPDARLYMERTRRTVEHD
jgi:competence protein CoiA